MKNVGTVRERERESSNLKNKKGITLIALVVTIVVLLILAGVTILTLTGENGILKRASNAAEATQKETATEKINLKITNIQINTYAKEQRMPTLQEIADAFYEDSEIEYVITKEEVAAKEKIDVAGYDSIYTKLSEYPYEFEIDSSLRLASINGVKVADNSSSEEIATLKATIAEMQGKITELENNQTTTNTEITTLKQKDTSLENSISNINTSMGTLTFTELASTTSTSTSNTVTLKDNLSNYKYVIVALKNSGKSLWTSGFISVDMFTHGLAVNFDTVTSVAKYTSNTTCNLYVVGSSVYTAVLYGIK